MTADTLTSVAESRGDGAPILTRRPIPPDASCRAAAQPRRRPASRVAVVDLWELAVYAGTLCLIMLWWPLSYDYGVVAPDGDLVLRPAPPAGP